MTDSGTSPLERGSLPPVSDQTRTLRTAARALRMHLRPLPIVFHHGSPTERFLAELAFPFARLRYECADSLLGAGFGGTVLGSMARSLFTDGLRWLWISDDPEDRLSSLLHSMLNERNRICLAFERNDLVCPILPRWLAPLNGVTDLTGDDPRWSAATSMPNEEKLLNDFLSSPIDAHAIPPRLTGADQSELRAAARSMMAMAGLRGAVAILSHAGHGNLLGAESNLTEDGVIGHDLRPDHEALFVQLAAVGTVLVLLGEHTALQDSWPIEVPKRQFLARAVSLTAEVVSAASSIHGLGTPKRISPSQKKAQLDKVLIVHRDAIVAASDMLPDMNTADHVLEATRIYREFAETKMINPWTHPPAQARREMKLPTILTQATTFSSLNAAITAFDDSGSQVIAVFAARMLLEEAARFHWIGSMPAKGEIDDRVARFHDDLRARRAKAIAAFSSHGVPHAKVMQFFSLPSQVVVRLSGNEHQKPREPLPSVREMLIEMSADAPERGWLDIAYSILSQVMHSTPVGHLHFLRSQRGNFGEITPEIAGLALDVTCLGSAILLGMTTMMLMDNSDEAYRYALGLHRLSVDVHNFGRLAHGLD